MDLKEAFTDSAGSRKGPLNVGFFGPSPAVGEIEDDDGEWWNLNHWVSRAQYLRCGPIVLRHGTQSLINFTFFAILGVLTMQGEQVDWLLVSLKLTMLFVHGCLWAGERPYARKPDKLPLVLCMIFLLAKLSVMLVIIGRPSMWMGAGIFVTFLVRLGLPYLLGSVVEALMKGACCYSMQSRVTHDTYELFLILAVLGTSIQFIFNSGYVFWGACKGWYAQKERIEGVEQGPCFGFHNGDDVGDALFHFAVF